MSALGLSHTSFRRIIKNLNFHSYKLLVLQELKPQNYGVWLQFTRKIKSNTYLGGDGDAGAAAVGGGALDDVDGDGDSDYDEDGAKYENVNVVTVVTGRVIRRWNRDRCYYYPRRKRQNPPGSEVMSLHTPKNKQRKQKAIL